MRKILLSCIVALTCLGVNAQFFGIDTDRLSALFAGLSKLPYDNSVMIMKSTLLALEKDPKAYRKAAELIERMGNPADTIHNEVLYVEALKNITNQFVLSNSEKERPKLLLEMAQKNHLGKIATDITYLTKDGQSHNLLNSDKLKLVFFNDLNCDACTQVKAAMAQNDILRNYTEQGKLEVISIYTGNNEKAWKKSEFPNWVINGWDHNQQIENDEAYVLMTTPLFYLLNSDNIVLVKNEPSLTRIEEAVTKVVNSPNTDSRDLIKLLFNK